jgi:hypothetical protein
MGEGSRHTEFKRRVSAESFLRVLPRPLAPPPLITETGFVIVPREVEEKKKDAKPDAKDAFKIWRITISLAENPSKTLGLEIRGDVSFGASPDEDTDIDIDLTGIYDQDRGVSQKHMLLRPGKDKLFMLDLGSRNGTYANGTPVTRERTYAVQDGDIITLGRLHLRIKIVERPS